MAESRHFAVVPRRWRECVYPREAVTRNSSHLGRGTRAIDSRKHGMQASLGG